MSAYQVAVVEDAAAPADGSAVVRITGLRAWPADATLRISPIDEQAVPAQSEGWPWGDLKPLRVTATEQGLDVVLGPEVANKSKLLPGTPISIRIGAAQLEAEALWPSITPPTRRRAGTFAMSATQLLAAKAERERAEQEAASSRRQEQAEVAARLAREAAEAQQKAATVTAATAVAKDREKPQLAELLPMRRGGKPAAEPGPTSVVLAPVPPSAGSLTRRNDTHVAIIPGDRALARRGPQARSFVAGAVAMAAAVAAFALLVPARWLPGGAGAAKVTADAQIAVADLQGLFKDFSNAGLTSPRRKSASNVDVATALSLADHSLRGQRTPAENEEAEFWLKRALATNLAGADVGWALTQLGTIYARADSPAHSYVKAHTLWQLAAAQGDPVAHCFLGALYEHGLGVVANKQAARVHYEAADQQGACRSAKDAAARLKD